MTHPHFLLDGNLRRTVTLDCLSTGRTRACAIPEAVALRFKPCGDAHAPTIEEVRQTLANPKIAEFEGPGTCCSSAGAGGSLVRKVPRWNAATPLHAWHLASLDAPTVAVVWALGFAWVARVRLPAWVLAVLTLVVWAIYAGDRLLDARKGFRSGQTDRLRERHFFHWRHRRVFVPLAVLGAIAAAGLVLVFMPAVTEERDTVMAAAALAYLTRIHAWRGRALENGGMGGRVATKEFLVGVVFAAGCALPAWNLAQARGVAILVPAVFFAALAWLNCAAIERWESARDGRSIAEIAAGLALAGAVIAALISGHLPRPAALLVAGAAAALLIAFLDQMRGRITPLTLRAAADLVLLTPLALLWR